MDGLNIELPIFRFPNEFIAIKTKAKRNHIVKGLPQSAALCVLDNMVLFCYTNFAMVLFGRCGKTAF